MPARACRTEARTGSSSPASAAPRLSFPVYKMAEGATEGPAIDEMIIRWCFYLSAWETASPSPAGLFPRSALARARPASWPPRRTVGAQGAAGPAAVGAPERRAPHPLTVTSAPPPPL